MFQHMLNVTLQAEKLAECCQVSDILKLQHLHNLGLMIQQVMDHCHASYFASQTSLEYLKSFCTNLEDISNIWCGEKIQDVMIGLEGLQQFCEQTVAYLSYQVSSVRHLLNALQNQQAVCQLSESSEQHAQDVSFHQQSSARMKELVQLLLDKVFYDRSQFDTLGQHFKRAAMLNCCCVPTLQEECVAQHSALGVVAQDLFEQCQYAEQSVS